MTKWTKEQRQEVKEHLKNDCEFAASKVLFEDKERIVYTTRSDKLATYATVHKNKKEHGGFEADIGDKTFTIWPRSLGATRK